MFVSLSFLKANHGKEGLQAGRIEAGSGVEVALSVSSPVGNLRRNWFIRAGLFFTRILGHLAFIIYISALGVWFLPSAGFRVFKKLHPAAN